MSALAVDTLETARFTILMAYAVWQLSFAGRWTTRRITAVDPLLRTLELLKTGLTTIVCTDLDAPDTAGARLMNRRGSEDLNNQPLDSAPLR
ncbi:MAG: hypothetical protein OSB67_11020 [Alphaproteobacteria bacterium]|nr:hypothetical protein [Alphaproteobacteria bacterium]